MFDISSLDIPSLVSAGGHVRLPGSKSISNRVLLLAALSEGPTLVEDLLDSDDTRVMLAALRQLGCAIDETGPASVRVQGLGGQLPVHEGELFLGNAGTAMRPLTAALALMATAQGAQFELAGVPRMHERPIGDLVDALRQLGCPVECLQNEGYPPLRLGDGAPHPLHLSEPIRVRGDVSSQFLTALLLALPLVARDTDVVIEVVTELISKPYIEITLNLLQRFGVIVRREGWQRFTIPRGSRYASPGRIAVEADASSASYFIALGAIAPATPGTDGVVIEGVGLDSIQGDIRFVEAARLMGAEVADEGKALRVRRGAWPLKAIDLDCNHIPDAAMTLAVMALYADGTTTLRNIASWRVKETDRIAAMAIEGRKLGATIEEGADFIRVTPPQAWRRASIHTYDDHRVAMCFSLAAFNPAGLPVRIEDPKCVGKTFPDYFETFFSVCHTPAERIPVICIDGPTASGKGTLAAEIASRLGYHLLDSGALYRLVGLAAEREGLSTTEADLRDPVHAERMGRLAAGLDVRFTPGKTWLDGEDVTEALRAESAGMAASRVSAVPQVRAALVDLQLQMRRLPGLVADGRDMGTVIFPAAPLKIYLTASAGQRAQRRHKQLISKGIPAILADLLADLQARDARDMNRAHAPLKPAEDAVLLDNSELDIEQSVQFVLKRWHGQQAFPAR
ncbi:MAG: bifunctional 3-phosphoshikimate 1-carboxyvinyltransferase/cytidylate kinase [Hydrogenophaga sp.]|uniref:bifunctional 3-phosphoshikimate 1-carboxyvinyltransferase/cytidylate kinase n=1 Tax=Hydrogenophaga sp. TaxID=1904254 RepID=UPI00169AB9B3|nr:bifunctional 3-phosphoshikimate 1-carboxyvinyltransferase/cytidylate kinase [Hydrogenophaga sp.]NIM40622.1 bifunctional 3-phosphoshikimate 1-carboxyvinyltransferase/cytidylate kinase [Hydrogenophaga sp.]NIN26097.1 bifunctional 3-phosphoshikimate 1-carboxyvinyltransferase/cytidylate kinase [Hydrogenophaga sp.]NIN30962.1 bifunctional 3-phosphoshikimate 1-carboxyvinyltransferase/cytidylate kinase [Hydrogenophaga sp.]NIN55005.1 bifunctional 3-phosphoshikimate 1-carboxyvinyltransferase/cytidylate